MGDRDMNHRFRLLAALPALIGVVLLLLAGWGFDGGTVEAPTAMAHHAEPHVPTGHHDTTSDAACALMCLAQRPVASGPAGYRYLALLSDGPVELARLPMQGRTPTPPWHPPEIV